MTVLIDSDILIDVSRARNEEISAKWMALSESAARVLCSPVSVAELWSGVRATETEVIQRLFRALPCVPIDEHIGCSYMLEYGKSHGVQLPGALIAATAVMNGAALWTRNRKHYR